MSSDIVFRSEEARINIVLAKQLFREILGEPEHSTTNQSDELVDLIFTSAVLESNACLRYVLRKT